MSQRALFLSGSPGDTRRYRVDHPAEALRLCGWRVRRRVLEGPWTPREIGRGEVLILHRVPWAPRVAALVEACRAAGGLVLFDTDDLVFAPEAATRLARLRDTEGATPASGSGAAAPNEGAQARQSHEFAPPEAYMATLQATSGALVTTGALATAVEAAGRPARVVRNAIDLELLRLSSEAWWAREARLAATGGDGRGGEQDRVGEAGAPQPIVIGYASGTATHDRDFALCAPVLQALMQRDARIRLRLFGPLDIGAGWEGLASRVERVPYMDWRQLPQAIARLDINLAPLETTDAFSRAKSELKFFEAGAVGVPTIASDTPAFRHAIEDGVDGLLVRSEQDWAAALEHLVGDTTRRAHMGRAARSTIVDRYVSDVRGPAMASVLERWLTQDAGPSGSALHAAHAVAVATPHAHTAAAVRETEGATRATPMAVDDVPGLARHAMGADYILERDAALAAPALAPLGPWLAAWLDHAGARVASLRAPAIDPRHFHPGIPAAEREHLVAADLRSADRSTRELAVRALAAARAADPSIQIVLFGPTPWSTPELDEVVWQTALDAASRAALLRRAAVWLDPSATNPLPALAEALACGCPVLTCDAAPTGQRQALASLAVLAPPHADALGARLAHLLRDGPRRARMAATGLRAAERWTPNRTAAAIPAHEPREDGRYALGSAGWQIDRLQPLTEAAGPTLSPGHALSQSFECALDGLGRFGWRLAWPRDGAPSGTLRLELNAEDEDEPAAATDRRTMERRVDAAATAAIGEGWTWFECKPLEESAGRRYVLSLAWTPDGDGGEGGPGAAGGPRVRVLRTDRFPGGRTRWDGAVVTAWTPAFATACRPRIGFQEPGPDTPPPSWAAAVDRMHVLAWRAGEDREALALLEDSLPFRLAETLARWGRPLPPMSERPWPPDASTAAKLLGTLRHYGPLALAREAFSFLRWLRLSDNERATVMRRER